MTWKGERVMLLFFPMYDTKYEKKEMNFEVEVEGNWWSQWWRVVLEGGGAATAGGGTGGLHW